jgi:hypothetical protein
VIISLYSGSSASVWLVSSNVMAILLQRKHEVSARSRAAV